MTRMKTRFAPDELVRIWLAQSQSEGRTHGGGNLYFYGPTIYSYGEHFPIAFFTSAPNGERVLVITTRTYSITTAKHISLVRRLACTANIPIIYCAHIIDFSLFSHNVQQHELAIMQREYNSIKAKFDKARKPERYAPLLGDVVARCVEFCRVCLIPVPEWAELPKSV